VTSVSAVTGRQSRISDVNAVHPRDAGFLADAHRSLVSQSMPYWEWLLQGDGDVSAEAERLSRLDPRVRPAMCPPGSGVAVTRNAAVARATASVVRNLDADDMVASPEVLERTLGLFGDVSVGFVLGPVLDVLADGTVRPFAEVLDSGRIPAGTLYPMWEEADRVLPAHPTALAVRRGIIDAHGGYPLVPHGEDTAFLLPMSQTADGWFADFPVALHRKREGSMTARLTAADRMTLGRTRDETARRARELAGGGRETPA